MCGSLPGASYRIRSRRAAQRGGAIVARCNDQASHRYDAPTTTVLDDSAAVSRVHPNGSYQVSTSLVRGAWTLLGSPWDLGPVACHKAE